MEELFKSFCVFGADKGAQSSGPVTLDGAKFAKMAKDLKLLDKNLTSTDIDIIFTKVKPKNEFVLYVSIENIFLINKKIMKVMIN